MRLAYLTKFMATNRTFLTAPFIALTTLVMMATNIKILLRQFSFCWLLLLLCWHLPTGLLANDLGVTAGAESEPVAMTFTSVSGGNLFDPGNWQGGVAPANPIPAGTELIINHRFDIDAGETVTNAGHIRVLTGGSLRFDGGAFINQSGGILDVEDNLLVFDANGSSIENQAGATINTTADAQWSMGSSLDPAQISIDNFGAISAGGSVFIYGRFTNHPGGVITSELLWTVNVGASFINQGTFTQTGVWRYENFGLLDNTGGSFSSTVSMTGFGREIVGTDFTHTGRLFPRTDGTNP
ncbi:MAG: hypothetical protein AAGA62_12450, partial [Bacteroidota bacterium]